MASHSTQCPNCGAPLEVPKDASDLACKYCGTAVRVERTRKPPPPELAKPQTVYVRPGLPGFVVWIIVLTGVVPMFIPLFIFVGPLIFKQFSSHFGSLPTTCSMNDELEIVGQNFSGSGTVVVAELNCKLTIRDSKLSGDVAVETKGNVELTVENSTLEGRDAALKLDVNSKVSLAKGTVVKSPETAISGTINVEIKVDASRVEGTAHGIDLGVNGKVWLSHKAQVTSNGPLVRGEQNLELSLDDSVADSKELAVSGGANTKIKAIRGAKIHGGKVAIRSGSNLRIDLEDSTIRSEGTAVCAGYNTEIVASHSALFGGVEAFRLEHKPNELDLNESTITGAQIFDSDSCSAPGAATAAPAQLQPPIDPHRFFPNVPRGAPRPTAQAPTPVAPPAPAAPPFDGDAAARALDAAARSASANCHSSKGKPEQAWVNPGFSPDGVNRGAVVGIELRGTPEEACILRIFQGVRIPPFDPATRPSGLGRPVNLK